MPLTARALPPAYDAPAPRPRGSPAPAPAAGPRRAGHPGAAGCVAAPSASSSERYQASAAAARPGRADVPQTSDSVRRVSAAVLVRWASLTALAQGPSASNRQSSPPTSIAWPEALKTYDAPAG